MPDSAQKGPIVHIVGICGSGKSSLAHRLIQRGYQARQISQEHSGVPHLWRWRCLPDALVFLDASNEQVRQRYPTLNMTDAYLQKERARVADAREHANCYIDTDGISPDQVADRVAACLAEMALKP